MNNLITHFEDISSLSRSLILAGGITFFWIIESILPCFNFKYKKWRHAGTNIFFTITTIIVNLPFAFLIVLASHYCTKHHFGLLQWLQMPFWVQLPAGLLVLDLIGAYAIHLIQHKVKWMWRFHMVHHADIYVDTTTANRHHPVESVFRAVFTCIAVFAAGAPIWMVMFYQSLSVALSQFNHANIKMASWLDAPLRAVFVTPNMHRIHHHYMRPETDSNYGNIFSFWDKIFGTHCPAPSGQLHYGLDVLTNRKVNNIGDQLKMPFDSSAKTGF